MTKSTPATDAVRLVPVEPTEAMMQAAFNIFEIDNPKQFPNGNEARRAVYKAMVAAAPAPATATGGDALSRWVATAQTPFADGGLGDDLYKRGTAYLADYVLSTEGADHEPSEFERVLLEDAFAGLMGDEALFGPIRTVLAALASQPQATGGAAEREAIALAEYVCGLLPSLAGAADQPDNKVYAAYANKGEIMGARDRLAALKTTAAPSIQKGDEG